MRELTPENVRLFESVILRDSWGCRPFSVDATVTIERSVFKRKVLYRLDVLLNALDIATGVAATVINKKRFEVTLPNPRSDDTHTIERLCEILGSDFNYSTTFYADVWMLLTAEERSTILATNEEVYKTLYRFVYDREPE